MTEQPEKNTPPSVKRVFIKIPEGYYDWPNERQTTFLQQLIGEMAEDAAAEVPTGLSAEELWNEAIQALVRCDAAEFLSEEYMAESRTAQDLFEQAAQAFTAAGNTEMATEAAQAVARLARFNSLDWGDLRRGAGVCGGWNHAHSAQGAWDSAGGLAPNRSASRREELQSFSAQKMPCVGQRE